MKCSAKANDYHLLVKPKFKIDVYDCQCKIDQIITGSMNIDLIKDLLELNGVEEAKDAWWEYFLYINKQYKG